MGEVKTALRNRLIAAGVNGGAAIFDTQAPLGTAYPYIIFQYVGGGDENQTALDTRDEVWLVKAVTDDHSSAHSLAAAIRAALHQQSLSLSGWGHLTTQQLDHVWQVENLSRQQIYHAGASFRIRIFAAA